MDELGAWLCKQLDEPSFEDHRHVRLFRGAVVDLVMETPKATYLVETKTGVPRWDDLARLQFLLLNRDLLEGLAASDKPLRAVLVAAAVPQAIKAMASRQDILVFEAPIELLPIGAIASRQITTERAWRVCVTILRRGGNPGVRALSREALASVGWTSTIVQQLRVRDILDPSGQLTNNGVTILLDQVATERPMKRLERARVATGILDWDEFELILTTQWNHLAGGMARPGMWVCGLSAASRYSGYSMRHDQFEVYATDLAGIQRLFYGRSGGIELVIYAPDRDVMAPSTIQGGLPTVSLSQALLDVAGLGHKARDVAIKLTEVVRG